MTSRQIAISVAAVLAVTLLTVVGIKAYHYWYDRKAPNFNGTTELYIYPWTDPEAVCDSIIASGNVRKPASVRRAFKGVNSFEVGHYTIDSTCTSMYAMRMVHKGWQTPVNLTLSSIRTPAVFARKVGAQMLVDSLEVAVFISSADSLGFRPAMLFTRIIPDTYQILWTASVREIMEKLFREADAWWTPQRRAAAGAQGLTVAEACTLASIVNGETRYVPEQPAIAAVYLNRLKSGMKLQADPTIAFCFDYEPNRILKRHLDVDSPYNTYKHFGLPPGPISCPPKSCLEAVLHPDSHSYIFFCADPSFNGTHRFATTYAQHLQNAREFQKALTIRQRNAK